jgi:coenzyme F420-dependent oxidoreductase
MALRAESRFVTDYDVHLPVTDRPIGEVADLAERAERLGYDRVWQPETWGRDGVAAMTAIAERTDEIGIGSSILNVYSRSPALLGQTAATLQEHSGGRFRLGIGSSGPIVIDGWHGASFDRPLRRTREAVEIIKQVCSGETVEYDGDIFQLSGFRLRASPPEPAPPVDVAALGPKNLELAGRFADGWHGTVLTPEGVADCAEHINRGAELGGRDPDDIRNTVTVTACVDEDPDVARDLVRQHLAFYVGGMGTYYRDALARQGYEDLANEIAEEWSSGNREAATDLITDDLLDDQAAAGTPEQAREGIQRFMEVDAVDAVGVSFPRGASVEKVQETLHAVSPE